MPEKIVFKKVIKVKESPKAKNPRIGVRSDLYQKIAYIANHRDTSMADIASQLVEFALEHSEISEEVEYIYDGEN